MRDRFASRQNLYANIIYTILQNTIQTLLEILKPMQETSTAAIAKVSDYFKVLSEVSRLLVLCTLKSGTKNVSEIVESTGLGQANVSKHLKILTQAGFIERTPKGVSVYYQITDPVVFQLCELVSHRLSIHLEEQAQHSLDLKSFQRSM